MPLPLSSTPLLMGFYFVTVSSLVMKFGQHDKKGEERPLRRRIRLSVILAYQLHCRRLVKGEHHSIGAISRRSTTTEATCHHCTSTPSVIPCCFVSFLLISFSAQNDDDDNDNGIVWINPNSGVTFVVDKRTGHSYPRTPLSREFDEDNAQAIHLTRRTIAVTDSGDCEEGPPQWIVDALKVGTAPAGLRRN